LIGHPGASFGVFFQEKKAVGRPLSQKLLGTVAPFRA
jgi:hypothetical protein